MTKTYAKYEWCKSHPNNLTLEEDEVPSRSTAEKMTLVLGVLAEFQAAETILSQQDLTLGFDATTQNGKHYNSIHITTSEKCLVLSIDELAGGSAADYANHIITF